ncbi:MAG: tetratricopeptide repeat protein [Deinococcota bacterium]
MKCIVYLGIFVAFAFVSAQIQPSASPDSLNDAPNERLEQIKQHINRGDYPAAKQGAEALFSYFIELDDPQGQADVLNELGRIYRHQGNFDDAFEAFLDALEIYLEFDNSLGAANAYNRLGITYDYLAEPELARQAYDQAYILFEIADNPLGQGNTLMNIAILDSDEAARQGYLQALEHFAEIEDTQQRQLAQGRAYSNLGKLEIRLQHLDQARFYLDRALKLFYALNAIKEQGDTYIGLGNLYLDLNEPKMALTHYKQSWRTYNDIGHVYKAHSLRRLGAYYLSQKDNTRTNAQRTPARETD